MAFNFFGLKKTPVVEDVEAKVPMPVPVADEPPMAVVPQPELQPPVATPPAEPQPEVPEQMGTAKATREDVIAAYKIFLGRLPESMEVVDARVGVAPVALLVDFLASKEFLDQAPKSQLVLAVAKTILDERKQAYTQEPSST